MPLPPRTGPQGPPGLPVQPGDPGSPFGGWRQPTTDTGLPATPPAPPVLAYPAARVSPVDLPHFAGPFRFGPNGKPVVCDQDSPEDIGSCVYNIVVCPQGAKIADPDFGIPWPLFQTIPLDMTGIAAAVLQYEPRALPGTEEFMDTIDGAVRDVQLTIGVPSPSQLTQPTS